ncbi:MAG TPA: tetratricopeptide repeat protein [Terriglobia bacterium]|nr:tetratricopeptide repeat protein [Terriglobia bacterium]
MHQNRFTNFPKPGGFHPVKNFPIKPVALGMTALLLLWMSPAASASAWIFQSGDESPALIAQGFEMLSRKDAASAEAAFRKAIEARPEMAAAHRGLGLALWAQGKGNAALRELTLATQLAPDSPDAHIELGRHAWALSAQPDKSKAGSGNRSPSELRALAIQEMNSAAILMPQDAGIYLDLARMELETERSKDALAHAQEATRLAPSNPTSHVVLGEALLAEKEESEAEAEFKKALDLNPQDSAVHLELGQLRVIQHRFDDAQKEFRLATEVAPSSGAAYAAWAGLLIDTGHKAQARGLLEKAVALDANDWLSRYRLGTLLFEGGETARATAMLQAVTQMRPDFLPAREQLAFGLLRRGDPAGAATIAENLLAQNPHAPEGHHVMALVLWRRRDLEGSLAEGAIAQAAESDSTAMLSLEALELWQLDRKKEARSTFVQAAKAEPHLGTAEVFCRLIFCEARDIGPVEEFLRKNRYAIAPSEPP